VRAFERAYPEAFFIQIGSNDGVQQDPLREAIVRSRWRGIMLEPVPYVFERLRNNYEMYSDRIALDNVAVGASDGLVAFYHLQQVHDYEKGGVPQTYDAIGSFEREHVLKHGEYIPDITDRLVCTEVPSLTFESLCTRHRVGDVDLIHIDAEGYDGEIVRSIDLGRWRPRLLIYEHHHLSSSEQGRLRAHLEAWGI
jgi:FkbM family methyltransferase